METPEFPNTFRQRYSADSRVFYTVPVFKSGVEVLDEKRKQQPGRYRRRQAERKVLRQDTEGAHVIGGEF